MPISDSEPRYRLLDSNGDVVASFYLDDSDGFNIQEATNNNEITLASDGTFTTTALDTDELLSGLIGASDVSGAVHLASYNHSELDDLETAITNADAGDTVVLLPGTHGISGTPTVAKDLTLHLFGTLDKEADITGLQITAGVTPRLYVHGHRVVTSSVADTTPGVEINTRSKIYGFGEVNGVGGHGWYFNQDSDTALNSTYAEVAAFDCGGTGVRVEKTGGTSLNLNAMKIIVSDCDSNGDDGFRITDGRWNQIRIQDASRNGDGTTGYGVNVGAGAADFNDISLQFAEGNDTNDILLQTGVEDNQVRTMDPDAVEDNGTRTEVRPIKSNVVHRESVTVPAGGSIIVNAGVGTGVPTAPQLELDSDPGSRVNIDYEWSWDSSNTLWQIELFETTGNADADVTLTVER